MAPCATVPAPPAPCALNIQVRVERDGQRPRRSPRQATQATATVQGLLPEDDQHRLNRLGVHSTPLMWQFTADGWCNPDLADATLRVTTEDGREVKATLPDISRIRATLPSDCQSRGRSTG